jgi:cytochrome c5
MKALHTILGTAGFRVFAFLSLLIVWIISFGWAEGAATSTDRTVGRDVFLQNCAACHVNGVAQAPRIGVPAEWESRLTAGRQNLLKSVLRGKGGMPPKGGNASISDAQAAAALDYIFSRVLELEHEAQIAKKQ